MLAVVTGSLTDERDALLALAPLPLLLWFAMLAGIVWLLAVGVPFAVRIAWQLGVDPRRRLFLASNIARLLAPFVALLGAVAPFSGRAPTLCALGLPALILLVVAVNPSFARNLAAGVGLAMRGRPRPGEQIQIGELEGTVIAVGSTRVSLRAHGGGVIFVPAADFERLPVTVGKQRATVPVEVDIHAPRPFDDAALLRLRRALWFSPFRRAGTAVGLAGAPDDRHVRVVLDTWAPTVSRELERHVGDLARRSITPPAASTAAIEDTSGQAPAAPAQDSGL